MGSAAVEITTASVTDSITMSSLRAPTAFRAAISLVRATMRATARLTKFAHATAATMIAIDRKKVIVWMVPSPGAPKPYRRIVSMGRR